MNAETGCQTTDMYIAQDCCCSYRKLCRLKTQYDSGLTSEKVNRLNNRRRRWPSPD